MNNQIPAKFKNLERLRSLGLKTPATLFLNYDSFASEKYKASLRIFLEQHPEELFIIRSAVEAEDGETNSFAGHFHSSEAVGKKEVKIEVEKVFQKNLDLAQAFSVSPPQVNLMVQPFIESQIGGVIFTQWKYFHHHYLVNLSTTPQKAVSGIDTTNFIWSRNPDFLDLEVLEPGHVDLKNQINKALLIIDENFVGNQDIEFAYTPRNELCILQIRPVTVLPQYLSTKKLSSKKNLMRSAYTENLAFLSPLSFSLIEKCYTDNLETFRALGFKSERFDFLEHLTNGEVFSEPQKQANFFKLISLFTPFKQTMKEPHFKQEVVTFLETYKSDESFNFRHLSQIFSFWMISNFYAHLKKQLNTNSVYFGNYELSKQEPISSLIKSPKNWGDYSFNLKCLFFRHLNHLKQNIKPEDLWYPDWNDFEVQHPQNYQEMYVKNLNGSIYSFQDEPEEELTVVSGKKSITGITIKNPTEFKKNELYNKILVAPHFDNHWILYLEHLGGVVLEQGSLLSHSSIVAREKKTPFFINVKKASQKYKPGGFITLNPKKGTIKLD